MATKREKLERTTTEFTGKVVGHLVRFLPRKERKVSFGTTKLLEQRLGAFVQLQIDGRRLQLVQCPKELGTLLAGDREPTQEDGAKVYANLVERHPIHAERKVVESVERREAKGNEKTGAIVNKWCNLKEAAPQPSEG